MRRWASGVLRPAEVQAERARALDRAEGAALRAERVKRFLRVLLLHLCRARRDNLWLGICHFIDFDQGSVLRHADGTSLTSGDDEILVSEGEDID